MTGLREAIGGALIMGALMTFGDWVWAVFTLPHRAVFGLAHGLILCCGIGAYLGALRRQAGRSALAGGAIGLGAAALFYALAPFLRYGAMFPAWMAFWLAFALLVWRFMGDPKTSMGGALLRGGVAALASGLAFYAISGIWTRPSPGGPDLVRHFASWSFAFAPGFLSLLLQRRR